MPAKLRSRLTFANVVASTALFVALGGTSYAALTITGKNIKNNTVTTADVRNASLRSNDFKPGQLPAGPPGATGSPGPQGPRGLQGASGEGVGYAAVAADGTLTEGGNNGVSSTMIRKSGTGVYCIKSAPFGIRSAMVSANNLSDANDTIASVLTLNPTGAAILLGCDVAAGERTRVRTYDVSSGELADRPFTIWFPGEGLD